MVRQHVNARGGQTHDCMGRERDAAMSDACDLSWSCIRDDGDNISLPTSPSLHLSISPSQSFFLLLLLCHIAAIGSGQPSHR